MIYLSSFRFPSEDDEWRFRKDLKMTCYQTIYPFYILPQRGLSDLLFAPVTILYGGNGSGKSTVLNVIAEKLRLKRSTAFNRSPFYGDFVDMCDYETEEDIPADSAIVTSDDVFDFMLDLRAVNEGIDNRRDQLIRDYYAIRDERFQVKSLEDYDHLHQINEARRKTRSRFADAYAGSNIREQSNGESAIYYFRQRIREDALYLLDEPENSLSPENQRELAEYLEESVRYCGCQLIMSTHSPFLLALPGARIIDLDHHSRIAESWTELDNVRVYYDFFKAREHLFNN